ncbi:MAG: O-antigen ligase family protein [Verrucomicrobia bacterium]|nr:O-antigen ligase family protein [Verrucomicrobiota bacterium]
MRYLVAFLLALALFATHLLIGGTRILFALPGLAALALAAGAALLARRESDAARGWIPWTAVLFFGFVAVRSALSPFEYLAWPNLSVALACLVVYILSSRVVVDAKLRLLLVAALVGLAVYDFGVGARQFRSGGDWMPFGFLRSADYRGRASGSFICPNHLAGFLNAVALFAFAAALWIRRGRAWRLAAAYFGVLCLAGVVLTGSRGGFLSLAVGGAVLAALALHRRFQVAGALPVKPLLIGGGVAMLVAIAGIVAIGQSSFLSARAERIVDPTDIRLKLWRAAWAQFQLEPVIGTGAGTFLIYGRTFRQGVVQDPIHVHNDYLHLAAEYGLVGLLAGLGFAGAHLWAGWRSHRRLLTRRPSSEGNGSNAVALNQGALAATAALLAHSVVDFNLHIPANALLYAWIAGLLASGHSVSRGPAPWWVESIWRALLLGPGLWLGWFAWQRAAGEWHAEQARVALRDGQAAIAIREAREGLAAEGRNPWLHFYLGEGRWALAQQAREPAAGRSFAIAALEAYTRAAALSPLDSRILIQQAWLLTLLGRSDEAGWVYARALAVDPANAGIWRTLGHHYRRHGQPAAAREAYQRAVELAGDAEARANLEDLSGKGR